MLSAVSIKNYRGFKAYDLEGLSRVNLFVGRNNSGKTAVLEGLQFLTAGGDPSVLGEVADRRGELIFSRNDSHNVLIDVAHFFHGHTLAPDLSFSIIGDNGYVPVTVKVNKGGKKEQVESRDPAVYSGFVLSIQRQHEEARVFRISRDGGVGLDYPSRGFRRVGMRPVPGTRVRFVGPDSLDTMEMASMYDDVTLAGQEADVWDAMRVLEPKLSSVHFLTGLIGSGFVPARAGIIAGFQGQDGRLPLGSMGDGMRRMMALATALAFAKHGCLFVDEIDTGLHYSVMADMWKLVVNKSVSADTQVFATTHSWDCIEGLSRFCQEFPRFTNEVSIHKIDREISHSIAFSGESVVKMGKADIDPR